MQAESSLSRESSENEGGESEPSTHTQGPSSASQEAEKDQAEQVGIFFFFFFFTTLVLHMTAHNLQPARHLQSYPSQWFCFILFCMHDTCIKSARKPDVYRVESSELSLLPVVNSSHQTSTDMCLLKIKQWWFVFFTWVSAPLCPNEEICLTSVQCLTPFEDFFTL